MNNQENKNTDELQRFADLWKPLEELALKHFASGSTEVDQENARVLVACALINALHSVSPTAYRQIGIDLSIDADIGPSPDGPRLKSSGLLLLVHNTVATSGGDVQRVYAVAERELETTLRRLRLASSRRNTSATESL